MVIYDTRKVSYEKLCDIFWETHDPTNRDHLVCWYIHTCIHHEMLYTYMNMNTELNGAEFWSERTPEISHLLRGGRGEEAGAEVENQTANEAEQEDLDEADGARFGFLHGRE